METQTQATLSEAVQLTLQMAEAVGQKTGRSPVELLVFAAASALAPHMTRKDALTQFGEARQNLVRAGLDEKK